MENNNTILKTWAGNLPWELQSLVLNVRDDEPNRSQIPDFIWNAGESLGLVYMEDAEPALTPLGSKLAPYCTC